MEIRRGRYFLSPLSVSTEIVDVRGRREGREGDKKQNGG